MGCWGVKSNQCDGALDLADDYRNIGKIRKPKKSNEADHLGAIIELLEGPFPNKAEIREAIKIAEKLISDDDYIMSYVDPAKRQKELENEVKFLKGFL